MYFYYLCQQHYYLNKYTGQGEWPFSEQLVHPDDRNREILVPLPVHKHKESIYMPEPLTVSYTLYPLIKHNL